jgi:chromosome segregation ATPase
MKRRENLLRFRRFRVDELKRRVTTLETMHADVVRKLADLEEAIPRERQRSNDTDISRLAFPSVLRAMDSRRENLQATLNELERERGHAARDLEDAAQDLKSLELAAEQEVRRSAEEGLRKSSVRLADVALTRQLRRHALRQI